VDENVDVIQRNMDPVSMGLIVGVPASVLIVLGGTLTLVSEAYKPYTEGSYLFVWLMFLSALMVGQFIVTYTIVAAWMQTPSQSKNAVAR
jgi:hypothetical protein